MLGAGLVVQIVNFDALAVFSGALKEVVAADVSFPEVRGDLPREGSSDAGLTGVAGTP